MYFLLFVLCISFVHAGFEHSTHDYHKRADCADVTVICVQRQPICYFGLGQIEIGATGGSGNFQYSIDNGASWGSSNNFSVYAGTYNCSVTDLSIGCTAMDSSPAVITSGPSEIVVTYTESDAACHGIFDPQISGGVGPYIYTLNGSAVTPDILSGKYVLEVTDRNGCNKTEVVTIGRVPYPLIYDTSLVPTTGGILTITGTNFSEPFSVTTNGILLECIFSPTSLECTIPPGNGGYYLVYIRFGDTSCQYSNSAYWSYMNPQIESVTANLGGNITLHGENFGNGSVLPIVAVHNQNCIGCVYANMAFDIIFCDSCPLYDSAQDYVVVIVDGLASNFFVFTYNVSSCEILNGLCDFHATCYFFANGSRSCSSCPNGTMGDGDSTCKTVCGDDICDPAVGEDCVSCPQDCKLQECGVCGDLYCDSTESCSSCPTDCPCSTKCAGGCENGGTCNNRGQCTCVSPWTGPTCSSQTQPIVVQLNETNPTATVGSNSSGSVDFYLSIYSIAEVTNSGETIYTIFLSKINFTRNDEHIENNSKYNYSAILDNGAFISIIVEQIGQPTTLEFANVSTTYAANTIKFYFFISKWPFKALTNTLLLTLDSKTSHPATCFTQNSLEKDYLRWAMIVVDDVSLYGYFEDKAVLDGRIQPITYSLSASNNVVARLSHFWTTAEMDPSFSVLLNDKQATKACSKDKKANNTNKIVEIVVPVVVGLAVIAAIIVIITPRLHLWRKLSKTDRLTTSDFDKSPSDVEIEKRQDMQVNTASGRYVVRM